MCVFVTNKKMYVQIKIFDLKFFKIKIFTNIFVLFEEKKNNKICMILE